MVVESTSGLWNIVALASVAGFASSVLGGLVVLVAPLVTRLKNLWGNQKLGAEASVAKEQSFSKKFIGLSFIFAASVLLTLVFVDFLPHAIGHGHYHTDIDLETGAVYRYWYQHSGAGIWLTVLGLTVGVGLVVILSFFDGYGHEHVHGVLPHSEECSHEEQALTRREKKRMFAAAFSVALAIILHDLPKGLAIGSAGSTMAAVAIGLSCVPEGMSIAIPLKAGGAKWWKVLGICAFAGLATVIGAVIGYWLDGLNVYLSGFMFAVSAGCILGVVFSEILPFAMEYSGRSKWKFLIMLVGVLLVVVLNYFFHDLAH